MGNFCDLHTHSHYSDGTFSPARIIAEAERLGLSAVALTDHNTVAGLPEFLRAARGCRVQAVPGVELSTLYGETELHIVGLFLKPDSLDTVTAFMEAFNRKKAESNRLLVLRLNRAGYPVDYDAICRSHPEGTVNRAVIAAALLEKGCVSSISEAFQGVLSKRSGYYVPPERLPAFDAIAFLHGIRAVPVLAHPFLNLKTGEALRAFLKQAVPHGLAAMETMYSAYSPQTAEAARQIAREFGLMESGGSDFHGETKPHISLGSGKGGLAVPAAFARILENSI